MNLGEIVHELASLSRGDNDGQHLKAECIYELTSRLTITSCERFNSHPDTITTHVVQHAFVFREVLRDTSVDIDFAR